MFFREPYGQNFIWKIYLKIVIYSISKYVFSENKVAMTSTFWPLKCHNSQYHSRIPELLILVKKQQRKMVLEIIETN